MSDYTITPERIAEIIEAAANDDETLTAQQVIDYCTYDWPEGDTHQEWLDTAPAREIARWIIEGLWNAERDTQD